MWIKEYFFSMAEAEIALCLSMLPESSRKIFRRCRSAGGELLLPEVEAVFEDLARRGVINGSSDHYGKLPFVVGLYEFQVGRLTPGRKVSRYDSARELIRTLPGTFAFRTASAVREEGRGTSLTREETLDFLVRAEKEGLVLQGQNTRNPVFICCSS
jgi:hypothetical protein